MDGVGEWDTASIGHGRGNKLELLRTMRFPHSIGLLYSAMTYFTGFKVNSGEYKLMGLAPYGDPKYAGVIRDELIDLREDGSFAMDMQYFNYCQGLTMTIDRFDGTLRRTSAKAEYRFTQREMDLAAVGAGGDGRDRSAHGPHVRRESSGSAQPLPRRRRGVELRRKWKVAARERIFDHLWIQPAAGDAGGALGAALFAAITCSKMNARRRRSRRLDAGSYLGPGFPLTHLAVVVSEGYPHHFTPTSELRAAWQDC